MRFPAKQIDRLQGTLKRAAAAATILTGTGTYVVTPSMAGSPASGSDSVSGVLTAAPQNKVNLNRSANGRALEKADGTRIFGRITFAATVFTLTLYVSDGAGGETPYSPVAGDALNNVSIDIIYGEVVKWENILPTQIVNGLDSLDDVATDPNSHLKQIDNYAAPTLNQTAFALSQTPKAGSVQFYINGMAMMPGVDFTVAGSTITYVPTDFAVATTDKAWAVYDR